MCVLGLSLRGRNCLYTQVRVPLTTQWTTEVFLEITWKWIVRGSVRYAGHRGIPADQLMESRWDQAIFPPRNPVYGGRDD